jgi:flagellar hook-associated protein 1 FlgK
LNTGAATVAQVRQQADSGMATSVSQINSLLTQFTSVNATIVANGHSGADISAARDSRDQILTQLSQQLGISTSTDAVGSMSIFTDSGVTLFQGTARTVTFSPSPSMTSGSAGNAVLVGGVPITGAVAPMAVHSGALAGLSQLRDQVAPQYGAQLDQIAYGLVSAFSESPVASGSTAPTLAGLFTGGSTSAMPSGASGLATAISVNANVDPSAGGNVALLRDGGISSPGNAAYKSNTTGAAGFTGRIQQLIDGLSSQQAFDPAAGIGAQAGLLDYANQSVSFAQAKYQQANSDAERQSAVATQAQSALSNASGVNLDTELNQMLNLENSYSTSAKILSTLESMFNSLISAVPAG